MRKDEFAAPALFDTDAFRVKQPRTLRPRAPVDLSALAVTMDGNPNCRRCSLWEGCKSACIMGEGPVPCDVAVYGESPGPEEDALRRSWMGPVGKFLRKALEEVGLPPDQVYLSNVLKCKLKTAADGKRIPPTAKQAKACAPYREAELRNVKPRFIILLGDEALRAFTRKGKITAARGGEIYDAAEDCYYLPTYHPSYVMRDQRRLDRFWADLEKFVQLIRGEAPAQDVIIRHVLDADTALECFDALGKADIIAADIETTGLIDYRPEARVLSIALCGDGKTGWAIPLDHPQSPWSGDALDAVYEEIFRLLYEKQVTNHATKFDLRWLARLRGFDIWKMAKPPRDTKVMSHLLDENEPKGHHLKPIVRDELGAPNYAAGVDFKEGIGPCALRGEPLSLGDLLDYNAQDAVWTHRLDALQYGRVLQQPKLARLHRMVLLPAYRALIEMELNGVYVDPERLPEHANDLRKLLGTLHQRMFEEFGVKPESFRKQAFLINWIYGPPPGGLGIPITDRTEKTGRPVVSEKKLAYHRDDCPAIDLYLDIKEVQKLLDTYLGTETEGTKTKKVTGWPKLISPETHRLYPYYNPWGTVTGRASAEKPNVQQTARDPRVRSVICAPPGYKLVSLDYAQIELRVAAAMWDDGPFLKTFAAGRDPHREGAAWVTGKALDAVTYEERSRAKGRHFGYLYGMGAPKYQGYAFRNYGLRLTLSEAEEDRRVFFEQHPGVVAGHELYRGLAHSDKQVESLLGRMRHLPDIDSTDRGLQSYTERQAVNSPIQSTASDFTYWSMGRIYTPEVMIALGLSGILPRDEIRLVAWIHDALLFEVREDKVDYYVPKLKEIMETLPLLELDADIWFPVPLVVDVETTQCWGDKAA